MLQMQIGSGFQTSRCRSSSLARNPVQRWLPALALTLLGGFGAATDARAQAPPAGSASEPSATAQPAATSVTPLPRFVPRDKLILYVDFDGLDAHAEAWQKTAAYKMLNQTPLGVMLEEVAAQLLDKALEGVPNRKLSGAEIVTLVKLMARKGWVLALNANLTGPNPFVGTLVLRGAAAKDKEIKSITSRLIGTLMGPEPKPRIERKAGRVLVVVPRGPAADGGWVWWPEKEDLVIGLMQPSNSDAIIAALDGKAPSAADHAILKELAMPEGSFVPLMTAILDPTAATRTRMAVFFEQLKTTTGLSRLDYRWGFDDDALMSVTRLVAPAPRKPALAIFDQPPLDTKNLIPMPEGVESFVMLSLSPAKALEAVGQIGPAGEVKEQIDELMEKVRSQSRIDFDKDFLSNLGPRMAIYLEPGRSAAATDEAPQTPAGLAGLDPMAMLASLQGALPTPTLVAELRDPVTFGKALDSIMLIVNKELKAQAIEKAAEDGTADEAGQGPEQARGPGRGLGGAAGPGGRPAQAEPQKHARARVSPHARQCQDLHAERSHRFAAEDPPAGSAPDNPDGGEPHRLLADLRGGARPSTRSRRRDGNPDRTSSRRSPTSLPGRSSWWSATRERPCPASWPACRERSRPRSTRRSPCRPAARPAPVQAVRGQDSPVPAPATDRVGRRLALAVLAGRGEACLLACPACPAAPVSQAGPGRQAPRPPTPRQPRAGRRTP